MSSSYHRDKEEDTEKIMKNVLEDWMKRGVLVAISIPIFTAQLEKSREATDAANLRSAYAEAMAAALDNEKITTPPTASVTQKQTAAGWSIDPDFPDNFPVEDPTASGSWTLSYRKNATTGLIDGVTATHS